MLLIANITRMYASFSSSTVIIIWFLICAGFIVAAATRHRNATSDSVHKWANNNDLDIIDMKVCLWQREFFWTLSFHSVYQVTVKSKNGTVRKGWVRASSISNRVDVKWDVDIT